MTSNKCLGREAKQVQILSCYALPAFSSSMPEIIFNKLSQTSFSFMYLWNRFWDSCASLTTKTSCRLCGLIAMYMKKSLPLLVLRQHLVQLHLMPSSFHRVWENRWSLPGGHLRCRPPEAAPSPPVVSSLSWETLPCPSEHGKSIRLAQQCSEATACHKKTAKLLWFLTPGGGPGSFVLVPGCPGLEPCSLLSHSRVPLPSICSSSSSIAGKLGKSLKNLEQECDVLAVKECLQNIYRLFKQLASTFGNNLSRGCLPALLGGRKT